MILALAVLILAVWLVCDSIGSPVEKDWSIAVGVAASILAAVSLYLHRQEP